MLTTQDIKTKYGDDVIFLFKGEEPFTEINGIPGGVLIERDGKVCCYECNQWFTHLGSHFKTHNLTAREYKIKYGFNLASGLCSKKISQLRSEIATRVMLGSKGKYYKKGHSGNKNRIKNSMQSKNAINGCPEQVKKRLSFVFNKVAHTPTYRDAKIYDPGLPELATKLFGSWNNALRQVNLHSIKDKQESDLIYDLRKFVQENNKLPWTDKKPKKETFPHSKSCYINRWGSWNKAKLHCGIGRTKSDPDSRITTWKLIQ